jgi:hypothetical protein
MDPKIAYLDLTQRPPRSMRQRLGGFVLLPRILDKAEPISLKRTATSTHPPTNTWFAFSVSIWQLSRRS